MHKRYVAKQFFDQEGKAMNSDALSAAVNLIEAKALFEGEEHPVHVRVAEHNGNIYLDLCNDAWQVVEITANGWHVIDESPVKFRRSRGMLPLPAPVKNGVVDELRNYLNVDDATWPLVVAWLIANLRPIGPYPLLALFAEQGSGKSTTGRLLRSLVDPNSAPLRAEPKDGRDLMIAANNSWCLTYRAKRIVESCKAKMTNDLSASRVQAFLSELREEGTSLQTSNHYLRAIKQLTRWLVKDRRAGDDPLAFIAMLNVSTDRRHDRRPLSEAQLTALLNAAKTGPVVRHMKGEDRAMLYAVAAYTGLRASELASLTSESFKLDDEPPTVTVQAAYSKHRRQDVLPLHPSLVSLIRPWLADKPTGARTWPGRSGPSTKFRCSARCSAQMAFRVPRSQKMAL